MPIATALLFGALLAAEAGPGAPSGPSVALLGLTGGSGMDPRTLGSLEEMVLTALSDSGRFRRVVGRSDIASVLGWEANKQKLGCDESSSCVAEIAGALGVDFVAALDVGRFGEVYILSLKILETRRATVLARGKRKVAKESGLPDAVDPLRSRTGCCSPCSRTTPPTSRTAAAWAAADGVRLPPRPI